MQSAKFRPCTAPQDEQTASSTNELQRREKEMEGNLQIKTDIRDIQAIATNGPYLNPGSNKLLKKKFGTVREIEDRVDI